MYVIVCPGVTARLLRIPNAPAPAPPVICPAPNAAVVPAPPPPPTAITLILVTPDGIVNEPLPGLVTTSSPSTSVVLESLIATVALTLSIVVNAIVNVSSPSVVKSSATVKLACVTEPVTKFPVSDPLLKSVALIPVTMYGKVIPGTPF